MPNANPSGANQPLDKNPTWMPSYRIIGADTAIFADVDPSAGDLLVIAPPSAGGVRIVQGESDMPAVIVNNASGVALVAPLLVYKDAAGNEAVLFTSSNILNGAFGPMVPTAAFPLIPGDQGIFLRMPSGGAPTGVSVTANWTDVDNVEVRDVELAGATKVALFPAADPGEVLSLMNPLPSTPLIAWALNKDDVTHDGADITMTQEEGSVIVPFRHGSWGVLAAGIGTVIFDDSKPVATPEIVVNVADATAVSTIAPVIRIAFTRFNQGPVAQDTASAF